MRLRTTIRLAPAVAFLAGLVAFVGIAIPDAHASTPTMTTEVVSVAHTAIIALAGAGAACLEGLHGLGGLLSFDPHGGSGSGATACPQVRELGLTFLGLMALVVIALGRMRLQTEQRRLDVVRRLIEQGLTPPRTLLEGPARRDRRKGVVLLFSGLGLVTAGIMLGDRGLAAGGLVPAFIGIGYLVSYRLALGSDEETGA